MWGQGKGGGRGREGSAVKAARRGLCLEQLATCQHVTRAVTAAYAYVCVCINALVAAADVTCVCVCVHLVHVCCCCCRTPVEVKDWDGFMARLQDHLPLLDRLGYLYRPIGA